MKNNQRVVKSIPDRRGYPYTKTSAGGKGRMQAAANYMDERGQTQLYTLDQDGFRETDRYEACDRIEDTRTNYQQHLAFTTTSESGHTLIDEREAARHVAQVISERRPDADIYALAVHSDGKGEERAVHVHAIVGTMTTLRHDDLRYFREESHVLEQKIEANNARDLSMEARDWIHRQQLQRELEQNASQESREQQIRVERQL